MNYNTCLDYLKYNSAMLHTNHFINMCSCSWRKPMWRLLGWLTFLYRTVKVNWTKCPWKNFSHREISSNALINYSVQFSMDCSMPGFPAHHQLLEITQTHVHRVGDAIQPSHPLSSTSLTDFNLYQHQGLFKWDSSSHQVAKVLEFPLQYQPFRWIFRTDFL